MWASSLGLRHASLCRRRLPLAVKLALGALALTGFCLLISQPPRVVLPTWRGYPSSHFRCQGVKVADGRLV